MARLVFAHDAGGVQVRELRAEPISISGVYRSRISNSRSKADSASRVLMEPLQPRNKLDLLGNLFPS